MKWRFSLYDRFGTRTVIDEPAGWDAFSVRIKRHPERHGTFRELQSNQFQFYGVAAELLKTEYELHGIRGIYNLKIEERSSGSFLEVYYGRIGFDNYQYECGRACYVVADLDQLGPLVEFINRFDQKVDLDKEVAFDGTTALTTYPHLTKTVSLPSKAILLRGISSNTEVQEYAIYQDSGWFAQTNNSNTLPIATGTINGSINVAFATSEVTAIKDYKPAALIDFYNNSQMEEQVPELVYNKPEQDLNCTGTVFSLDFRVKGIYKNEVTGSGTHSLLLLLKKGTENFVASGSNTPTILSSWTIRSTASTNAANYPFDITHTGDVTLEPGEKLWLDFFLVYNKTTNFDSVVKLQLDPETRFKVTMVSKCDPTDAKLYMINEAASRVVESITNNQLKLYSEYYGRINSAPYAMDVDGCGGLRGFTAGLNIRKAKLSDGTDPKTFVSMKDIFESLSAIDNVGIGQEGTDKIRIENWKYFYQDNIVHSCKKIESIKKVIKQDEHYSLFKNGYEKWEAEDYNGLDEFLTRREYRTALGEVQNTLEKICKMIASGYAWEVTRRKQNDTKDWRFDNDLFIACLEPVDLVILANFNAPNQFTISNNDGANPIFTVGETIQITGSINSGSYTITGKTVAGITTITLSSSVVNGTTVIGVRSLTDPSTFAVETGNITGGTNILDPDTVYNFRISPARNALRWFDRVAACYRNITNADKIMFNAGDGNFLAEGELADGCLVEAGALKENADISLESFIDPTEGMPIAFAERILYTFPLSAAEYRNIAANPYGLIEYEGGCEKGEGWIDEIDYSYEAGRAKFSLIPKIPS